MLKTSSITLPKEHELKRKEDDATTDTSCRPPVTERDHSQGPATAAITLVQYGDYGCPSTHQSSTVVRAIQQQLGDQLRFVFRNFPLTDIHPHALTLVITGLLSGGLWLWASSGGRLLAYDLNRPTFRFSQVRSFLAPTLFLLSAVVALWNPSLARILWYLI